MNTPSFPQLPPLPFSFPTVPLSVRRPRAARRRHASSRALPARRPPAGDQRATLEQFARRAADDARARGASALEVGVDDHGRHGELFEANTYRSLSMSASLEQTPRFTPFEELPVPAGEFGVVLCTEVVQRSLEPREVLSELHRVLEPRGKVYLSTPLIVPEPVVSVAPRRPRFGLNYLMEASGFRIEAVTALTGTRAYGVVAGKKPPTVDRRMDTPPSPVLR